ncbi:MAG: hypothetical protein U9Q29_04245 [Campylobacterota bacterium]|nr:hypothetical protein [Campylobacterota bacterium]
MGTLTKQERDGLEDVFLSIHSNGAKFHMSKNISLPMSSLLKRAKLGLREGKLSQFITILSKKKKYLSK